jgi:hypothetical protein
MATNDQDYRSGMAVGRITQLTETEQLALAMGEPAGAVLVMESKYDKELERLRRGIRHALDMYPTFPIDYNVRLRLEKLLQPASQEGA